jgi:hypothetical protein
MTEQASHRPDNFQNSPSEAYSSLLSQPARHSDFLGFVGSHETTEEARQRAITEIRQVTSGEKSARHRRLFELEAAYLGIDENEPGFEDRFIDGHRELMESFLPLWESSVSKYAEVLPGMLASDATDGEDHRELEGVLHERLRDNWARIRDPYLADATVLESDAYTSQGSREVGLGGHFILDLLSVPGVNEEVIKQELDMLAQHELMHCASSIMQYEQETDFGPIRASSGIDVRLDDLAHGKWINEASIEQYRRRAFNTGSDFAYQPFVAVLNAADAIRPDFEQNRLRAMLLHEDRGEMVGQLELIFGPLAAEHIQEAAKKVKSASDLPAFRDEIVVMVEAENRELATAKMNEVYELIDARIQKVRGAKSNGPE